MRPTQPAADTIRDREGMFETDGDTFHIAFGLLQVELINKGNLKSSPQHDIIVFMPHAKGDRIRTP